MSLTAWSWVFLFGYVGLMVGIGVYAQRRIKHADDFATARGAYGPVFLALAFAASTASGATFLGSPAMSYEWGLSTVWMHFLYPIGVYVGILISMRLVATSGNRFGNRSIPEYLGDRYQSDTMRLMVSLLSLVLFFYLAGQLVSGVVMFEIMLGLGENMEEVIETLEDLRRVRVDIVTLGQYLQPSKKHLPVADFVSPDEFKEYEIIAKDLGFRHVESGPLVRSSYKAHKHIH